MTTACTTRREPVVFVGRSETDGSSSEQFCVAGEIVTCDAEAFDETTWKRREETHRCDGQCGAQHDLNVVVEMARSQAKQDGIRTVRGIGAIRGFLRSPEAGSARSFSRWYIKRHSKGEKFCTGPSHLAVSWRCDTGVTAHYTSLRFELVPCDGSCRPLSKIVPA